MTLIDNCVINQNVELSMSEPQTAMGLHCCRFFIYFIFFAFVESHMLFNQTVFLNVNVMTKCSLLKSRLKDDTPRHVKLYFSILPFYLSF